MVLEFVSGSSCAKKPVTVVYLRYEDWLLFTTVLLDSLMVKKLSTESKNRTGLDCILSDCHRFFYGVISGSKYTISSMRPDRHPLMR